MLIQVSTPTSAAELRALYRRTRAHFALAPPVAHGKSPGTVGPFGRPLALSSDPSAVRFSGRATLRIVARHFGLAPAAIAGAGRLRRFVLARWIVMHICVEAGGYTAARAGQVLGRDHATVLHGLRELAALLAQDPALGGEVARLARQCVPVGTRGTQEEAHEPAGRK